MSWQQSIKIKLHQCNTKQGEIFQIRIKNILFGIFPQNETAASGQKPSAAVMYKICNFPKNYNTTREHFSKVKMVDKYRQNTYVKCKIRTCE